MFNSRDLHITNCLTDRMQTQFKLNSVTSAVNLTLLHFVWLLTGNFIRSYFMCCRKENKRVIIPHMLRVIFRVVPRRGVINSRRVGTLSVPYSYARGYEVKRRLLNATRRGTTQKYVRTATPLPSKHPILYIFSTIIRTKFFEHAAHTPFFLFKM
jgi:hypothetical protein